MKLPVKKKRVLVVLTSLAASSSIGFLINHMFDLQDPVVAAALIAAIPATVAAIAALVAARHSRQANDAVNHRHKTGTPRLYDLALENHEKVEEIVEWKRSYDDTPWNEGASVNSWIKKHGEVHEEIIKRLDRMEKKPHCTYPSNPADPEELAPDAAAG